MQNKVLLESKIRSHNSSPHTRGYLKFGRLKLDRNTTHSIMHNCWTTSCCTRGVAVAVKAMRGTEGYLSQSKHCFWGSRAIARAGEAHKSLAGMQSLNCQSFYRHVHLTLGTADHKCSKAEPIAEACQSHNHPSSLNFKEKGRQIQKKGKRP